MTCVRVFRHENVCFLFPPSAYTLGSYTVRLLLTLPNLEESCSESGYLQKCCPAKGPYEDHEDHDVIRQKDHMKTMRDCKRACTTRNFMGSATWIVSPGFHWRVSSAKPPGFDSVETASPLTLKAILSASQNGWRIRMVIFLAGVRTTSTVVDGSSGKLVF